jgi:TrmH family RNA methyltransferase
MAMQMLSKARVKYIKSLQVKKYRQQEQRFVVEGKKSVLELVNSTFHVDVLIATQEVYAQHRERFERSADECITAKPSELSAVGSFRTNDAVLAVARMKPNIPFNVELGEFALALDDIRDPGNLGAILRIADWYGIMKVITSPESADLYNAKTLHASMGSFTRVNVYVAELAPFLSSISVPVAGAFLGGESVHGMGWGNGAVVVIGNESNGISKEVERLVTRRITIPKFGGAESLNAAIATAVICDNIRRNA